MNCSEHDLLPENSTFYDFLDQFSNFYTKKHVYVALSLTGFSNVMNVLNFIVLTRPSMISSVNAHLAAIAIADLLTTFLPGVELLRRRLTEGTCAGEFLPFSYASFLVAMGYLSFVFHSISIWLSVFMAFTRFLTLRSLTPFGNQWYRSTSYAWLANGAFTIFILLLNLPIIFQFRAAEADPPEDLRFANCTYVDRYKTVFISGRCSLSRFMFWQVGVLFKVIPCVFLTYLSIKLIRILRDARQRREMLSGALMIKGTKTARRKERAADRTTKMMIILLLVFLVCEMPQGLIHILNGILGKTFFRKVYIPLQDVTDLLSLINCSVNFIIYCTMSEAFRLEFLNIFVPKALRKPKPNVQVDNRYPRENQTLLLKKERETKDDQTTTIIANSNSNPKGSGEADGELICDNSLIFENYAGVENETFL